MSERELEIDPSGPVQASIRPPGSKSITNRALICAALAEGNSRLSGALDSEDTQVMIQSLRALGLEIQHDAAAAEIHLRGCGGHIPTEAADLHLANSGTSIRFLTALCTLGRGVYRLDGVARMRERPIQDLLDALRQLGADAVSDGKNGCPPVVVQGLGLRGGTTTIRGDVSSQFLSGLLMAAPYALNPVTLEIEGELVSQPYIQLTIAVMEAFGVPIQQTEMRSFQIGVQQHYAGRAYAVEPDASAASYFWAAAAVTGGRVTVEGLTRDALQGDVAFCDCLARMGCRVDYEPAGITVTGRPLRGIAVDMNAISDTVQTLTTIALFAKGPTTITGVAHNRYKETDRIGNLAAELRKLGATVDELPDGLRVIPGDLRGAVIETYNDHRMAMSLALAGLRIPGVRILNPACTAKTYPRFFEDLRRVCQVPA